MNSLQQCLKQAVGNSVSIYLEGGMIGRKDLIQTAIQSFNLVQSRIEKVIDVIKTTMVDGYFCCVKNGLAGPGCWLPGGLAQRYPAQKSC